MKPPGPLGPRKRPLRPIAPFAGLGQDGAAPASQGTDPLERVSTLRNALRIILVSPGASQEVRDLALAVLADDDARSRA